MSKFKSKLKEFRISKGLSQIEMAEILEMSVGNYIRHECFRHGVCVQRMYKLKRAFPDADIDDIFFTLEEDSE